MTVRELLEALPRAERPDALVGAGLPVRYDRHVPEGTVLLVNGGVIVGTWTAPRALPSVASIVAAQRRRRHR